MRRAGGREGGAGRKAGWGGRGADERVEAAREGRGGKHSGGPRRLSQGSPSAAPFSSSSRSPRESRAVEGVPEACRNLGKQDAPAGRLKARATDASLCGASILAHVGGIPDPGRLQMETLRPREGK